VRRLRAGSFNLSNLRSEGCDSETATVVLGRHRLVGRLDCGDRGLTHTSRSGESHSTVLLAVIAELWLDVYRLVPEF